MRARRLLPRHPDLRLQRAVLGPLLRRLHAVPRTFWFSGLPFSKLCSAKIACSRKSGAQPTKSSASPPYHEQHNSKKKRGDAHGFRSSITQRFITTGRPPASRTRSCTSFAPCAKHPEEPHEVAFRYEKPEPSATAGASADTGVPSAFTGLPNWMRGRKMSSRCSTSVRPARGHVRCDK